MNRGNISSIATYLTESGRRRVFRCKTCEQTFSETRDTVFFDLRTPEEQVMRALKMLLVRVDLSSISFVLGVTEETVLEWLRRAAQQADKINQHLLRWTLAIRLAKQQALFRWTNVLVLLALELANVIVQD